MEKGTERVLVLSLKYEKVLILPKTQAREKEIEEKEKVREGKGKRNGERE